MVFGNVGLWRTWKTILISLGVSSATYLLSKFKLVLFTVIWPKVLRFVMLCHTL